MNRIQGRCLVCVFLILWCPSGFSPAAEYAGAHSPDAYERHVRQLKKKLPGNDFTIVAVRPFVVIGDDRPSDVRRRAQDTVGWAVEKLKAEYFDREPAEILDIWLFKDEESYKKHTRSIFHTTPDTPFGYYSHADRALVMNISTGGGTLVHEIVHPFVAANFPECPAWFNEGLGSLYEQCGEEDGRIHGYTNWRLPGLQKAIRAKQLPSFKTLCSTTTRQFYEEDKGTNYAQARYLCYFLQQCGLLREFYREFHAHCAEDPTGYATLQKVLGQDDIDAFQRKWEKYVMTLRFPDER